MCPLNLSAVKNLSISTLSCWRQCEWRTQAIPKITLDAYDVGENHLIHGATLSQFAVGALMRLLVTRYRFMPLRHLIDARCVCWLPLSLEKLKGATLAHNTVGKH